MVSCDANATISDCLLFLRPGIIVQVGGSPGYTMTEDYALGMELKKEGYQCRYVREYLALGVPLFHLLLSPNLDCRSDQHHLQC